ncbi:hypothetical protein [Marivivens sp. JLT3646]|uniref:hypothetical protein n=1 Tax=Marivivens sp. JLT3646 TaxID=1920883 RepID=UPI0007FD3CF6|nr:hypothetical protein [Marivivens sp. JLT3646]APO87940.1 hypothetical protein BSK21_13490 [Marivivens sp. JLT3646]OBR35137.1 hypothetical protein A9199_12075 [Donghicola sp. JL3646]
MNYTTKIIKAFDELNKKIIEITKGEAQLCDYDTFLKMLEACAIPDHIDTTEIEQFISEFQAYGQNKFEDELADILDNLKDVSDYVDRKTTFYQRMSNIEIISDLSKISDPFRDSCEYTLYNIRLKLNEDESSSLPEDMMNNLNECSIDELENDNNIGEEDRKIVEAFLWCDMSEEEKEPFRINLSDEDSENWFQDYGRWLEEKMDIVRNSPVLSNSQKHTKLLVLIFEYEYQSKREYLNK